MGRRARAQWICVSLLTLVVVARSAWPPAELDDNSTCDALGVNPWSQTVSVNITSNGELFLPVFAYVPPTPPQTALVLMHGLGADANSYFCTAINSVREGDAAETTMVVTAWFGDEKVTSSDWSGSGTNGTSLFWTSSVWVKGGDVSRRRRRRGSEVLPDPTLEIGAFTALDSLAEWMLAEQPQLTDIVFAGFSAGGQLVQRWAIWSEKGSDGKVGAAAMRFIVGDPGSYTFLSAARPDSTCIPMSDTGPSHTCDTFSVPAETCNNSYDSYKYGLADLADASYSNSYLDAFAANETLVSLAVERLAGKDVRFLLGTNDACNCNTDGYTNPDTEECFPSSGSLSCSPNAYGGTGCCDTYPDTFTSNAVDVSCEAMLQGSNRLQRGLNFVSSLPSVFANYSIEYQAVHSTFVGGHDMSSYTTSDTFITWAYGSGGSKIKQATEEMTSEVIRLV